MHEAQKAAIIECEAERRCLESLIRRYKYVISEHKSRLEIARCHLVQAERNLQKVHTEHRAAPMALLGVERKLANNHCRRLSLKPNVERMQNELSGLKSRIAAIEQQIASAVTIDCPGLPLG